MNNQTDWTLLLDTTQDNHHDQSDGHCPVCGQAIFNFMMVGRPSLYCSDSCKMKAYRQRQKALRNTQRENLPISETSFEFSEQLLINQAINLYNLKLGRVHSETDTYFLEGFTVFHHLVVVGAA